MSRPRGSRPRRLGRPARGCTAGRSLAQVTPLNMVLWSEPLIGEAVLKTFGLAGDELTARRFRRWLTQLVGEHLSVP